jgi:hypothetical protein
MVVLILVAAVLLLGPEAVMLCNRMQGGISKHTNSHMHGA